VHQGGTAEGLYHNDHGAMKQHQLFTSLSPFFHSRASSSMCCDVSMSTAQSRCCLHCRALLHEADATERLPIQKYMQPMLPQVACTRPQRRKVPGAALTHTPPDQEPTLPCMPAYMRRRNMREEALCHTWPIFPGYAVCLTDNTSSPCGKH
jgi:hypothetical protein